MTSENLTGENLHKLQTSGKGIVKTCTMINIKNCSLSIVLTATDQKLQKIIKKVILPTITSLECQHDAEQYHLFNDFCSF